MLKLLRLYNAYHEYGCYLVDIFGIYCVCQAPWLQTADSGAHRLKTWVSSCADH